MSSWSGGFTGGIVLGALRAVSGFMSLLACAPQVEAMVHPFFDEIRDPNVRLPNGKPLPALFNFKKEVSRRTGPQFKG